MINVAHIDVSGDETGLAIGEIVFPQPPEAVVEAAFPRICTASVKDWSRRRGE
jgi:hypothetical protein